LRAAECLLWPIFCFFRPVVACEGGPGRIQRGLQPRKTRAFPDNGLPAMVVSLPLSSTTTSSPLKVGKVLTQDRGGAFLSQAHPQISAFNFFWSILDPHLSDPR
jgi:hypothetical protein